MHNCLLDYITGNSLNITNMILIVILNIIEYFLCNDCHNNCFNIILSDKTITGAKCYFLLKQINFMIMKYFCEMLTTAISLIIQLFTINKHYTDHNGFYCKAIHTPIIVASHLSEHRYTNLDVCQIYRSYISFCYGFAVILYQYFCYIRKILNNAKVMQIAYEIILCVKDIGHALVMTLLSNLYTSVINTFICIILNNG